MANKLTIQNIFIYSSLFLLAFVYCFGIEMFNDTDMNRYFVNGFYMINYGIEGVKDYPNQMFSLFLYYGYKLTGSWYGLSNILFLPLYLFGVYSLHQVLNYFIKHIYVSLLFTLIFLLLDKSSFSALEFYSYTIYFFFFISIIYLCLYHPTKLYLLGFYFAVATLFRNQIITFLPFIPCIINPKLTKKDYLKTVIPFLVALVMVHVAYEVISDLTLSIPKQDKGVNFNFYFKELNYYLVENVFFSYLGLSVGLNIFFRYNLIHYYFYLVLIPCFFIFNKKFAKSNPHKPLLKVFLIMALFIYFMPAIMYVKLAVIVSHLSYFLLLSRYSFIMLPLLIPIYYFIIKNQPFIKLKNSVVYIAVVVLFLPVLSLDKAPLFVKNTFANISHKKEIYNLDSAKIASVIKANFKENSSFMANKWLFKTYLGVNHTFKIHYDIENVNKASTYFNLVDGIILIGETYPYLTVGNTTYSKIYQENGSETISIYKKVE